MDEAAASRGEPAAGRRWLRRLPGGAGPLFHLYALHLWALFGIALSNLFLGLAVLVSLRRPRRVLAIWRRSPGLLTPVAVYAGLLVVSTLLSHQPLTSARALAELLTLASLPLGLLALGSERRARWVVQGLIVVATLVALYGLGQLFFGYGGLHNRIRGPFSIYMTFAGYLMMADLLLVAQMIYARGWRSPWRWAALAAINAALVGSLTRSAWVGLAVALGALLLVRLPRLLPLAAGIAVVAVLLAPGPVRQRVVSIADLENLSNYDRLCMLEAGLHMIAERPFFGIGPGMVRELYPIYRHPTAVSQRVPHLHNSYVHLAAERGLPSLAAYLWLLGAAMLTAYRVWRADARAGGGRSDLLVGALAGLVAFSFAGLFEHSWGDTEVQRVALLLMVLPFALRARD